MTVTAQDILDSKTFTGYGYMIQVPVCLGCGARNIYAQTFAPKRRKLDGGRRRMVEVTDICGTHMAYEISVSTFHNGFMRREDHTGHWRRIWPRHKKLS